MDKIDEIILSNFKTSYPNTYPILRALLQGEKVADLAIRFSMKESSIRNLKSRYRELFKDENR